MNVESLVADLEERVCFSEVGANIGGMPCGAVFIVVYIYART